jgi:hypothetical protein
MTYHFRKPQPETPQIWSYYNRQSHVEKKDRQTNGKMAILIQKW